MPQAAPPRNRRLFVTGLVLVVLAVLCLVGTVTGFDARGDGIRTVFAVVATLLMLAGVPLMRSKQPRIESVVADDDALVLSVAGAGRAHLRWDEVQHVDLRWIRLQASREVEETYLTVELVAGVHPPADLRTFRVCDGEQGCATLFLAVKTPDAERLRVALPERLGDRYTLTSKPTR